MALERKSFKDSIKFKKLKFNDEYFSLKGEYINTSDGINFFAYKALTDVNDVKTNNFSNIFLTKKQKNSDILDVQQVDGGNLLDIVTTLSFFSNDANNELNPGIWLAIDKSYNTYDVNTVTSSFRLVEGAPDNHTNYLFRLHCIDETHCTISHTFGDNTYYLAYEDGFKCVTKDLSNSTEFIYHIDGQYLKLYFQVGSSLYAVRCVESENGLILALGEDKEDDENSIIYINSEEELIGYFIDGSWARYDRRNAIDAIKSANTASSLATQFMIHHEYSDDDDNVNLVPLKNNLTYQGSLTNGCNLMVSSNSKLLGTPAVDFRNYTNISSGCNQEHGSENITLTFTFTDQTLHLKEGDKCFFTIPATAPGDLYSSLYPYEQLNINDSAFARNGAFGSDAPFFADKFMKKLNEYSPVNSCTYLCTWLYQPNDSSAPVWVDRYYYPDQMSRKEALNKNFNGKKVFNLSFENILDRYYLNENIEEIENLTPYQISQLRLFKETLQKQGFIDKKSDLNLQGGSSYQYSRISKDTVEEVWENISKDRVEYVKDEHGNSVPFHNAFVFDNKSWRKIPAESLNKCSAISFNTNLYINPRKKIGIQLFGCDYKHGFNIQNRKDLCPFTYYADKKSVYIFNNAFGIANQFNLYEKYGVEVKYLVVGSPFDDLYVFSDNSLFIFDYDLRLKTRIEISTIIKNGELEDKVTPQEISAIYLIQSERNLFAIINNEQILKIIFRPDSTREEELCKNGPSCRFLSRDEYLTNYNMVSNPDMPQTTKTIKTIFVFGGQVYAFNYDTIKMSHDGDTLYGIIEEKNTATTSWYYIYRQSLSRIYTTATASKYAEFNSDTSIDNLAFGSDGRLALIRGFNKFSDNRCLEIYDRSKTKVYNYPLRDFEKILSLDFYRYIDKNLQEHEVFVALGIADGYLNAIEYQIDGERVETHRIDLQYDGIPSFKNIIDSNSFITRLDENKIYFNLFLDDNVSCISHEWDLTEAQEGWYNVNVELDMDEAKYAIKINDNLVGSYDKSTHKKFIPHVHSNTTIFDGTYYFGSVGKRYGTTLNEILNGDQTVDPYASKNSKCENTTLYTKVLDYHEYQASRLHFSKINPLTLTIPCGVRNGIDEIVRYFKYNKPSSYSNRVKINISGVEDIKTDTEMNRLRSNILTALADSDCLTTINEIEFI